MARHPAGSRQGGRFKSRPAPDLHDDELALERGHASITDRIANLAVDVRWQEWPTHGYSAGPVVPAVGPLAGSRVDLRLSLKSGSWGHGWYLAMWIRPDGAEDVIRKVLVVPAGPGRLGWAREGQSEARAAAVRLMHGDADRLLWCHKTGRWRPMSDLAGWLESR